MNIKIRKKGMFIIKDKGELIVSISEGKFIPVKIINGRKIIIVKITSRTNKILNFIGIFLLLIIFEGFDSSTIIT
jgi:hypothetical protein